MLSQSLCLIATTASVMLCFRPPAASKTVSKDVDKVPVEGGKFAHFVVHGVPYVSQIVSVFLTIVYLAFVYFGAIPKELTIWQASLTLCAVLGYSLRAWAFRALAEFFTYQLTIRENHKLIQTGPYTYLLHPSYTGLMMAFPGYLFWIGHGFWPMIKPHLLIPIPGVMFCFAEFIFFYRVVGFRIRGEEEMLEQHFGQTWRTYASQRWRLIPLVF